MWYPHHPHHQSCDVESNSREEDLDTGDLEMSVSVQAVLQRLETRALPPPPPKATRLPCFGFEGLLGSEDLARVSPVVCSKLTEVPRVPGKPWAPDTTPGNPPTSRERETGEEDAGDPEIRA
ncbi:sororin-like [Ursus arctos]|uniref:sororin-like n=1 Tax=Ursus arctos TaxID=9644 RepID=UPI001CF8E7E8|nr:sororin-like [Ursus arctos]